MTRRLVLHMARVIRSSRSVVYVCSCVRACARVFVEFCWLIYSPLGREVEEKKRQEAEEEKERQEAEERRKRAREEGGGDEAKKAEVTVGARSGVRYFCAYFIHVFSSTLLYSPSLAIMSASLPTIYLTQCDRER